MIALNSGTTSLDRSIFEGKVLLPKVVELPKEKFDVKVDTLLDKYGDETIYPNENQKKYLTMLVKIIFFHLLLMKNMVVIKHQQKLCQKC